AQWPRRGADVDGEGDRAGCDGADQRCLWSVVHAGMRAVCGLALLIVAGCDEAPPAATLTEVPAQFVGQWEQSLEDCAAGGAWSVIVAPTQVKFPDSVITVTGVAP